MDSTSEIDWGEHLVDDPIDSTSYMKYQYDNWVDDGSWSVNYGKKNHIMRDCPECGFYGMLHMKRIRCLSCSYIFPDHKDYRKVNRRQK